VNIVAFSGGEGLRVRKMNCHHFDGSVVGKEGEMGDKVRLVAYGGGVNSTAMVVELVRRGEMPTAVLFSDTGGEKPATYEYMALFNDWLKRNAAQELIVLKKGGRQETLEENLLRAKSLPSLAYGFHRCAQEFKIQPMDKWRNNFPPARELFARGEKIEKCIGYDAGEAHRAKRANEQNDPKEIRRYPLIEWDMGRSECIAAITAAGLPPPPKSSCFFCPASKPSEVLKLAADHPDLFARAVAIERNAETHSVAGLGRNFSWESLVRADAAQLKLFNHAPAIACACLDEDEEDSR